MTKSVLSVVIPVYNVAAYLPSCLNSLMAQTRLADEIVAVDDGSTDGSLEILWDYASRMDNLRIIRQANSGTSVARNAGLAAVQGRYVHFMDADDRLVPSFYECLLTMAEADQLDMAMVNALYDYGDSQPETPVYESVGETGVIPGGEWLRQRLSEGFMPHYVVWHLYSREFLLRNCIQFPPGRTFEDVVWTTRALLAAEKVRYEPQPLYRYRLFSRTQSDSRIRHVVESTVLNTKDLIALAAAESNAGLSAAIRWLAVDGGMAAFQWLKGIADHSLRSTLARGLLAQGYPRLLWNNARSFAHRRRALRHWVRSLIFAQL